jgi:hypothetical protein
VDTLSQLPVRQRSGRAQPLARFLHEQVDVRTLAAISGILAALACWVATRIPPSDPPPRQTTPGDVEPVAHAVRAPASDGRHPVGRSDPHHDLRVAAAARELLDHRAPGFRDDCSGYVASVLDAADALHVDAAATVAVFHADALARDALHHDPEPWVGDLVFFDNTWDRNGNGRMDDLRTHIAVVVDVEPDGTIVMAHKGSDRRLIRMNLFHPGEREGPDGQVWNSWLRRTGDRGNPLGHYRTGQLWSGFAHLPSHDERW